MLVTIPVSSNNSTPSTASVALPGAGSTEALRWANTVRTQNRCQSLETIKVTQTLKAMFCSQLPPRLKSWWAPTRGVQNLKGYNMLIVGESHRSANVQPSGRRTFSQPTSLATPADVPQVADAVPNPLRCSGSAQGSRLSFRFGVSAFFFFFVAWEAAVFILKLVLTFNFPHSSGASTEEFAYCCLRY